MTYVPIITVGSQFVINKDRYSNIATTETSCRGKPFVTSYWICESGQKIPADLVCNDPSAPDCLDGSDEDELRCKGGLNYWALSGIVTYLILGFIVWPSKYSSSNLLDRYYDNFSLQF